MYGEVKKGSREFSLARTSKDNPLMCIRVDTGCVSCKVSNILQAMKREGIADVDGVGHAARWYLKK